MRNKIVNISSVLVILFIGIFIFNACDKDEEVYERTRLFSPVLNEDLYSINNTIIVNMGKMKEASSYTIEISRDSFLTIDYSIDVNENLVTINAELVGEELLWFTMYQIRATAHANDANYDSKASDLGSVRTQKFPSNMTEPTFFDVLDTRAKVYWTPQGADITNVKVFALSDARLTSPLLEFELTPDEILANLKIVSGLTASTGYQIAIYSSGTLRGWEVYTTREAMVSGDNVVNLTGIDSTVNLADVLPDVADGSIVLLEGGKTYDAGGYKFDKSIAFQSGYSFVPALPVISCGSNFNMADGSNIDYITFKDIEITADGGFGGKYAFNIDKGGSIGEIKFESCKIRTLRGIARVKGGVGTLEKYTILNCVIDSIQGYGILTMDKNTWMVNDILIKNSTISKAQMFITSRNNSNSVIIEDCTISEVPEQGRQMFRWRESGQNDVINGITIKNTIWSHGWNQEGEEAYGVDGFDGMGNTNFTIINCYTTSEFSFADGKDEIPGFPSTTYAGSAADLWVNPYTGMDFNFKDNGFAGKNDSGDPSWRPF